MLPEGFYTIGLQDQGKLAEPMAMQEGVFADRIRAYKKIGNDN